MKKVMRWDYPDTGGWMDPVNLRRFIERLRWIEELFRFSYFMSLFVPVFTLTIVVARLIGIPLVDSWDYWIELKLFVWTLSLPVIAKALMVLLSGLTEMLLLAATIRNNLLRTGKRRVSPH